MPTDTMHPIAKEADIGTVEMVEEKVPTIEDAELHAAINALTPAEQKKALRQIDRRLIITLGLLNSASLLDRSNIGVALIAGLAKDLTLVGSRFSLVILVFFVSYVSLQPVATVAMRKIGPRIFLPTCALLWGAVTLSFGFVRNWTHMLPLRILLGVFEAGALPGSAYILSCWYPRYELQTRNTVFFLIGITIASSGGILAFGLSQMHGLGGDIGLGLYRVAGDPSTQQPGIAGWRWIFIIEGIITIVLGAIVYFLIVDFPEKATETFGLKFLTEKETAWAVARVELDRKDVRIEPFHLRTYLTNAMDLKIWAFAAIFGLSSIVTFGISYFMPIILNQGLGFGIVASQCLSAPPSFAAALVMYGFAILGDKYHIRSVFIIIDGILCIVGFAVLGFAQNPSVRYFGIFIATIGSNANIPVLLTWQANNIRGQWKRAVCSAILISHGGIGAIISSFVFRDGDKPGYLPGVIAAMVSMGLSVVVAVALVIKFHNANKRAAAGGKVIEGLEGFRYTL
ncbi:retrograde regulation protein 2 [Cadophora sp. DSE1049]|nr:retrograde regulation protein 2 [Cadophora sp. DSE1049]